MNDLHLILSYEPRYRWKRGYYTNRMLRMPESSPTAFLRDNNGNTLMEGEDESRGSDSASVMHAMASALNMPIVEVHKSRAFTTHTLKYR